MNKFFLYGIIGILVILNLYLLRKANALTGKPQIPQNSIQSTGYFKMKEFVSASYDNMEIHLNDPKIYLGLDSAVTRHFFDRIDEPTLVFRFSGNYCDQCLFMVVDRMKKIMPDFAINKRIVLLSSELNDRFKDGYFGKKTLSYQSSNSTLGLPGEKHGMPVLFLVGKDRRSHMAYVPDKSEPELLDEYLMLVKAKIGDIKH